MATKSAADLADDLAGLAERLHDRAVSETRRYVGDMLADLAKDLTSGSNEQAENLVEQEVRTLLKRDDWEITPEFLIGLRFAARAARDEKYEL